MALHLGLLLVAAPLYARLRGSTVLASGKRALLFEILREHPGISTADAARALGCNATTARHHLRTLAREGFAADHDGRYFMTGSSTPAQREALVAARDGARLLDVVRARPGVSKQEAADALGCARATVNWHFGRLERAGLVAARREGKCVRLYPAGAAPRADITVAATSVSTGSEA